MNRVILFHFYGQLCVAFLKISFHEFKPKANWRKKRKKERSISKSMKWTWNENDNRKLKRVNTIPIWDEKAHYSDNDSPS